MISLAYVHYRWPFAILEELASICDERVTCEDITLLVSDRRLLAGAQCILRAYGHRIMFVLTFRRCLTFHAECGRALCFNNDFRLASGTT